MLCSRNALEGSSRMIIYFRISGAEIIKSGSVSMVMNIIIVKWDFH